MRSQFAPASMRRLEGIVPEIPVVPLVRINGILRYKVLPGGWVWKRYFALDEPPADSSEHVEGSKRPCLELIYNLDEQAAMRSFVANAIAEEEPWH